MGKRYTSLNHMHSVNIQEKRCKKRKRKDKNSHKTSDYKYSEGIINLGRKKHNYLTRSNVGQKNSKLYVYVVGSSHCGLKSMTKNGRQWNAWSFSPDMSSHWCALVRSNHQPQIAGYHTFFFFQFVFFL